MTNAEKYKNDILEAIENGNEFAVIKDIQRVVRCCDIPLCDKCMFYSKYNNNKHCNKSKIEWMYAEYKEPIRLNEDEVKVIKMLSTLGGYISRVNQNDIFWMENCNDRRNSALVNTKLIKMLYPKATFDFIKSYEPIAVSELLDGKTFCGGAW